jgi:hypothetical protein
VKEEVTPFDFDYKLPVKGSRVLAELREAQKESLFPATWTKESIRAAEDIVIKTNTAAGVMSSIPMRCKGASGCPYKTSCPLLPHNLAPEGFSCSIEMQLLLTMFESLCEELLVDPDENYIDSALVRDLCNIYIQEARATKVLADEHFIMENVLSIDKQGNVVYHKEPHIAILYSDKLHKKKLEIMEILIATRMSKVKAVKGADGKNTAALMSKMGELLSRLTKEDAAQRRSDNAFDDIEEAQFEEIEE